MRAMGPNPYCMRDFLCAEIGRCTPTTQWFGAKERDRVRKVLSLMGPTFFSDSWAMRISSSETIEEKDLDKFGFYFVRGVNCSRTSIKHVSNYDREVAKEISRAIIHIPDVNYKKGIIIVLEDVIEESFNNLTSRYDAKGYYDPSEMSDKEKFWSEIQSNLYSQIYQLYNMMMPKNTVLSITEKEANFIGIDITAVLVMASYYNYVEKINNRSVCPLPDEDLLELIIKPLFYSLIPYGVINRFSDHPEIIESIIEQINIINHSDPNEPAITTMELYNSMDKYNKICLNRMRKEVQ